MKPIRIELPTMFGMQSVNCWLYTEPEIVLLDCGEKTDKNWDILNRKLGEHGVKMKDISKVFITHAHLDHMGMANQITKHSDAEIWMNDLVYDWAVDLETMLTRRADGIHTVVKGNLPKGKKIGVEYFNYKALAPFWEEIPDERIVTFPIDGTIEIAGQNWEVLYMPGHCLNQTCFYQRETKQLFSADMLLKLIPTAIIDAGLTTPYTRVKSLVQLRASYQRLLDYELEIVYPGHFEIFEDGRKMIDKHLAKIQLRVETVYNHIQNGVSSFMELMELTYPNRFHPITFFMVIGFLDILLEEERIQKEEVNGMWVYSVL